MNQQQLRLTQLLGSKELTFGCLAISKYNGNAILQFCQKEYTVGDRFFTATEYSTKPVEIDKNELKEIIGHPVQLHDFHKWLVDSDISWRQTTAGIWFENFRTSIPYDSSKDLLDQSPETLAQIIELITKNQ